MSRRDIGTDDPRVRVRPGKGRRPRTKIRPAHEDAELAMVTGIDRGRYRLVLLQPDTHIAEVDKVDANSKAGGVDAVDVFAATRTIDNALPNFNVNLGAVDGAQVADIDGSQVAGIDGLAQITAVKARELGRHALVVGDEVRVVGDLSGDKDTLARIVRVEERRTFLRRSLEEGDGSGREKPIVANVDQLLIVVALADPEPRLGMIDRCLVAAYDAGVEPVLVLTKSDLAPGDPWREIYAPLGLNVIETGNLGDKYDPVAPAESGQGLAAIAKLLAGKRSVLIGHSGVGKSSLINALLPEAGREIGGVNVVTGKGRHTSTSVRALPFAGGWVIDTPGVRSFGLAHVQAEDLLRGFTDLYDVAEDCPRGCTHLETAPDCYLDEWSAQVPADQDRRTARLLSYRRLLNSKPA